MSSPASPGFKSAQAAEKPTLACIGRVSSFGDCGITDSGNYLKQAIQLDGYGAGPNQRLTFLYRPEWLVPGFDSAVYEGSDEPDAKTYLGFYRKNIAEDEGVSTLLGLCGGATEDGIAAFNELAGKLFALDIQSYIDRGAEGIKEIPGVVKACLVDFFENQETAGKRIGYILRQQQQKTDETDDNGKAIYKRLKYYEVSDGFGTSGFFTPDEKGRKAQESRAARSQGKRKVTFTDEDSPF